MITKQWTAYDYGWDSVSEGTSNPHPPGSELSEEWDAGRADALVDSVTKPYPVRHDEEEVTWPVALTGALIGFALAAISAYVVYRVILRFS